MPHHQDRRAERQCRVSVAVQVNEVRTHAGLLVEQPLSRGRHVVPRPVHPFEPELVDDNVQTGNRARA
jgi:hypothetical protein